MERINEMEQVKIFYSSCGTYASKWKEALEDEINEWLSENPVIEITNRLSSDQ